MKPHLIIVAHGSSVNPTSATQVGAHSRALAALPKIQAAFSSVHHCYLKQSPNIEDVVFDEQVVVVPYFMAQGFFVETVLPRHLPSHARVTPALGTADFARVVQSTLEPFGHDVHLVLAGHGTEKDPRSGDTMFALAARCGQYATSVTCGFVDQEPRLETTWQRVPRDEQSVIVLPYFAFPGPHTTEDIPHALGLPHAGFGSFEVGGRAVHYLPPVTASPETVNVLADLALSARG